ncbi:hypothetical protein GCM10007852_34810 [Agaribacter marinus]|uniref:Transposase n=1 Tax=Agaribacter marinus TaxID=1431249 RepID=A0AA37WJX3_9ALTE|nr:hypothetical protein GCM10007852_34810 [Agaribacter marinus]
MLGQQKLDDMSNEITAVPKLLDLLNVKGCVNIPSSAQFKIRDYATNLLLNSLGSILPCDSCGLSLL